MSVRREERVETIRKVIRENVVTDQKMLLNLLKQYGVDATQATISRDLRLMGIVKKRNTRSGYSHYVLPGDGTNSLHTTPRGSRVVVPTIPFFANVQIAEDDKQKLSAVPKSSQLKKMTISGPFVILHTEGGYAQIVAKAIDDLHDPHIVATLSGYDTILVIPSEEATRESLRRSISLLFPELL